MITRLRFICVVLSCLLLATAAFAYDMGGGSYGSNMIPRVKMDHWIPGKGATVEFFDFDPGAKGMILLISPQPLDMPMPTYGPAARLKVNPKAPGARILRSFSPASPARYLGVLPGILDGRTYYMQGFVMDAGATGGVAFTNGTRIDFFKPVGAVGNSRQSSNSVMVFDTSTNTMISTIYDSENGYITYGPERRFMYVCEPGSLRNRVEVYDLEQAGTPKVASIYVTPGIRYGCTIARDGLRMYTAVSEGVSVVDLDPQSAYFRTEIDVLPTSITGSPTMIFEGPMDVAVTPDGKRLFVAMGEPGVYPGSGHVASFDLTLPNPTETLIPVTNGGTFFYLATRHTIDVSEDGKYVYTTEFGAEPGMFTTGFVNGSNVNVIAVETLQEVAAIPTDVYSQRELAVDRLNEWVYVTGKDVPTGQGVVIGIDVREGSAARFTRVKSFVTGGGVPYGIEGGPAGVDVTPDGSTLYVSIIEDPAHPTTPEMLILDAATGATAAPSLPLDSLCATLSIQQR